MFEEKGFPTPRDLGWGPKNAKLVNASSKLTKDFKVLQFHVPCLQDPDA